MLALGLGLYARPYYVVGASPNRPLDNTSDVLVALSTRQLFTAYSGPLIRLRRDSDNAESDFGFDGNGDLDTAAVTTWLGGATGYAVRWYNQALSGPMAGQNISQSTASRQPAYNNSALLMPSFDFDGVDDWMRYAHTGTMYSTYTHDLTSLAVIIPDSVSTKAVIAGFRDFTNESPVVIEDGGDKAIDFYVVSNNTTKRSYSISTGASETYQEVNAAPFIAEHVLTHKLAQTNQGSIRVNGVKFGGSLSWTGWEIGQFFDIGQKVAAANFYSGKLAEIIVIKSALADSQIEALEANQINKFFDMSNVSTGGGAYLTDSNGRFLTE